MKIPGLRSGKEKVCGIAFFARTLDKVKLHDERKLPDDYNVGTGFDNSLCEFLQVNYADMRERTLQGGTDEEILKGCFSISRRPSEKEVMFWNSYVLKLGWKDHTSEELEKTKIAHGFADRDDIETWVDFHDADEGRI